MINFFDNLDTVTLFFGSMLHDIGLIQVRLIVEAGGRDVVELADQCEKIRLDRLMPLEVHPSFDPLILGSFDRGLYYFKKMSF